MERSLSRRRFFAVAPAVPLLFSQQPAAPSVPPAFPAHDPDLVREVVGVSHGNIARVKELVSARPALARVSWDWGYGDWESPIDDRVWDRYEMEPVDLRGDRFQTPHMLLKHDASIFTSVFVFLEKS